MASALMRRSVWAATVATLAAVASPLLGQASAATFSGTTSSQPAPDSSNVVHANRPTLIGTFSDALKSGSTIKVWDKADSAKTNLCGGATISQKTVQCAVPGDLSTSKTYDAQAHGVRSSDGATADTAIFEFTVDYPTFDAANSVPPPSEAIVSGTEAIQAFFNETITGDSSSFQLYELNADGTRGNGPLAGNVGFPTTGNPPTDKKSVTFTPTATLADGEYEALISVNGVNSDGSKNAAAVGRADYRFYIDTAAPQSVVAGDSRYKDSAGNPIANSSNDTAFPFTGTAAPGTTVTVWVKTGTAFDNGGASAPGATTGSTKVDDCDAAPNCPWSLTVDLSNIENTTGDGKYDWYINTSDAGGKSTSFNKGGTIDLSTASPNPPASGSAQWPPNTTDNNTLQVSATGPAACTSQTQLTTGCNPSAPAAVGFEVKVVDPEGNSVVKDFNPATSLTNENIDVSTLDNGSLDVQIMALSADGNVSKPYQNPANPATQSPPADPTVTKASVFAPNFGTSTLTAGGKDVTFQDAETTPVAPLTKVTVEFNESIKTTYTDPTAPVSGGTHNSFACIAFASGNCDSAITVGAISATSDGHGLTFNVTSKIPDGTWALYVRTYSGGCPTTNGSACNTYDRAIALPAPATGIFTYKIDGTPPHIAVTSLTNPIRPSGLQTASIAGTADSDVTTIQLSMKSSNDPGTTKVATANVSNGTWSVNPLPLSGLVDGTLTITATGKDAAGNPGTATAKTLLSGLSMAVLSGDRTVLLTWQRPTLANGAAPSYTLVMADITRGTGTQLVSPPPSSSATSFRISNLVNGDKYGFQLKATDPNGNGPIARAVATPHTPTTISIGSSARSITYGTTVVLSGRLIDSHGYGVGGKRLSLYPVYSGGVKGGAAHPTTDTHGHWAFSTRPVKNATYVISFPGDSAFGSSIASVAETVKVAIRITSVSAKNSSHTTAVRIAGTVGPNEHGRHVYIYEIRSGKAVRIGYATLSTKSTFSFVHTWSRGTHVVFARFYSQNGITGNNSSTVKFTRS